VLSQSNIRALGEHAMEENLARISELVAVSLVAELW
jgi:hypothetical protein